MIVMLAVLAHAAKPPGFDPTRILHHEPKIESYLLGVDAGDLDGDGDLDAVAAVWGGIWWYENQGAATFGPPQVLSSGASEAVRLVDLDSDGDLDAAVIDGWIENLYGIWIPHSLFRGGFGGLDVADLEGDGDPDLLIGTYNDYPAAYWLPNLGGGAFDTARPIPHLNAYEPSGNAIAAGDFDSDGDNDVAVSIDRYLGGGGLSWSENDGAGNLAEEVVIDASYDRVIEAVDLDGDGDDDLLACNGWYEQDAGTLVRNDILMADFCGSVAAGDLDGDGYLDVVKGPTSGTIGWFSGGPGATFGAEQTLPTKHPALGSDVAVADLDGDGCLDVLYALSSDNDGIEVGWFRNARCGPPPADTGPPADTAPPADTSTADTAADTATDTAHTGSADTGAPVDSGAPPGAEPEKRCGCTSGPGPGGALWRLVRRRR